MPKKKQPEGSRHPANNPNVMGLHAAVVEQPITDTLETNYMPYAMSVIVSRAIPEIDGFKPSHRKLLYTMYKMGLLTGGRTKSANIVGQTMRLNPHGDAAIYDTMVRLSKGYGALLTPFVDSKGNFGKSYSRDMSWAAPRYTEAKLAPICGEIFKDIDSDTVDFVDNYDNTMKEPALLPTTFPNILVSANSGIAVGMASQFCGFNLKEVCDTTVAYLKNPDCDLAETLLAPDFPTGGELIFDAKAIQDIYNTGRGSVRVRAKYRYIKDQNLLEIYEIPYSTTVEAILDKVAELIKQGKAKEIADMRDETDLSGLKLAIDLKRGVDPDKLMAKLYRLTPLEDAFACNFNVLIAGSPKVLGVRQILEEWTAWRTDSVKRRIFFVLGKKKDKLHLLKGLKRILLDIDKAIKIIRETEEESEVIPNLMIGFEPRRTSIVYPHEIAQYTPEEEQKEEYPVSIFLSREGYFKKITPASLRMNSEQKFKEGDALRQTFETTSNAEVMFFTDHCQVYKTRLGEFDDAKASVLGDYLPTKLKMDAGENVIFMVLPGADYAGSLLFFYENGKVARIEMKAYQTASNRRKLTGAYSDKSPLACIRRLDEDCELAVYSNEPRCLIFHTALLAPKTTRSAQGVAVMTLKPKYHLETVMLSEETAITNRTRYRVRAIPAAGALVKEEDSEDQQISLL